MRRRRLWLVLLVVLGATCGSVSAASWHAFSSKSLGFALKYPAGWRAISMAQPAARQVQFSYQGTKTYTVTVSVLNLNAGTSLPELKKRFLAFQQRAGDTIAGGMRWSPVSLAGRRGIGGVYVPSTEGGVSVANGMYVIPWKTHTYLIALQTVQKPPPHSLSAFPGIYRQILATWHFL